MDTPLNQIINNLNLEQYPKLGSGSGRKVYDLKDGNVLKAAKNVKGYAQNQVEYIISEMDDSELFAKVSLISENSRFLIMQKAAPITDFAIVRSYFHVNTNYELFCLNNLSYIPCKYNLLISDLCRPANWGLLKGRPVIIDYGFTGRIRRQYYSVL